MWLLEWGPRHFSSAPDNFSVERSGTQLNYYHPPRTSDQHSLFALQFLSLISTYPPPPVAQVHQQLARMSNKRPAMELGTVLVVGGCGFVGWHIVNHLLNFPSETDASVALPKPEDDPRFDYPQLAGRYPVCMAKVAVVDLRTSNNRLPGAEYYDGDITSAESMLEVFRKVKPNVVIHTATPNVLEGNKPLLRKVNVDGTKTLLEVAGGARGDWGGKCKAFVYTSSSSVVHDTQSDLINVDEEWPYIRGDRQLEYYSETKVGDADSVSV